jgi:hypothetical protein
MNRSIPASLSALGRSLSIVFNIQISNFDEV